MGCGITPPPNSTALSAECVDDRIAGVWGSPEFISQGFTSLLGCLYFLRGGLLFLSIIYPRLRAMAVGGGVLWFFVLSCLFICVSFFFFFLFFFFSLYNRQETDREL